MRSRLVRRRPQELELVLGVQSPYEAAARSPICSARQRRAFKPARINAQFAYVGGGFGGRDHTPFPLYVALAAMFFPGRPVRLAHDRYQQFQGGIKRHAFKMQSRIGVDRASGKIRRLPPIMCSTAAASPTIRRASPSSAPPARSASMTFRRSTSPRSRFIRAASPPARCAATGRCRP